MPNTSYVLQIVLQALDQASGVVQNTINNVRSLGTVSAETQAAQAAAAQKSTEAWQKYNESITAVRTNMQSVMQTANQLAMSSLRTMMAGTALFAGAYFPIKEAAEFEHSMALVGAITKATSSDMKDLQDVALKMARDTVFSANNAAEAMQVLARAGLSVNQVITSLPSVLYMAAAGGLSMAEAAQIAAESIHAFNLSAQEMVHMADVIAHSATASNMNMKEFADAMKYVAPAATAAGLGVDEVAAALQVLANAGLRATMGGTTLRSILISLTGAAKNNSEVFAEMGVRTKDIEGHMRPLVDIFTDMAKANMTLGQASQLFTIRAASGAIALMKQVESLQAFTTANQNATGEAKRLADAVLNNLVGSLDFFQSSISALFLALTDKLLTPLKAVTDALSWVVNKLADLGKAVPPLQYLSAAFITLVGAAGALLVGLGGLGLILSGTMRLVALLAGGSGMGMFSGAMIKSASDTTGLALAMAPLGNILTVAWSKVTLLWTALMANPWTFVIAAVAALAAGLYYLSGSQERVVRTAQKEAAAATESKVQFDQLVATLSKTNANTSEHERLIVELTQKYPALAEQLRITNQSWKEQQEILKFFRAGLVKEELDKATTAMTLTSDQLDVLQRKFEDAQNAYSEALSTPVEQCLDVSTTKTLEQDEKDRRQRIANLQADALKAKLILETAQRTVTDGFQKLLKEVDWQKIGMEPLNIITASRKELEEFFNKTDELIQNNVKMWEGLGFDIQKVLDLRDKVTAIDRSRIVTQQKPIDITQDLVEAENTVERLISKVNEDITKGAKDSPFRLYRDQFVHSLEGLTTPLAALGAEVRASVEKDIDKVITSLKSMKSITVSVVSAAIAEINQLAGDALNKQVVEVQKKWATSQYPAAGGEVNWDAMLPKLDAANPQIQGFGNRLRNAINVAVTKFPFLTQAELLAMVAKESGGDVNAISPKGAQGIGQIMPDTWKDLVRDAKAYGIELKDVKNLEDGILAMGLYYSQQKQKFAGEPDWIPKALAAYNAGPGAVEKYGGVPPYKETQDYVKKITEDIMQLKEKVSKGVGVEAYTQENLKSDQARLQVLQKDLQTQFQGGMISTTAEARTKEKQVLLAQNANDLAMAQSEYQKLLDDRSTGDWEIKKKAALDKIQQVQLQNSQKVKEFDLKTLQDTNKVVAVSIETKIKGEQLVLSLMQDQLKFAQAVAAAQEARLGAKLEAREISGTEYQRAVIENQNNLYNQQMAILEKRKDIELQTAEAEKQRIMLLDLQPEVQRNALELLRLNTIKQISATETEIGALSFKHQGDQQKMLAEGIKGVRDIKTEIGNINYSAALGPVAQEMATWNKLLRDDSLLYDELKIKIGEMVEKWGQMVGATREQRDALAESLQLQAKSAIRAKEQAENPYIGKEAARWGEAMTRGFSSLIDSLMDGGTKLTDALNKFFKQMLKDALVPGMKALQQTLTDLFKKMFQGLSDSLGSSIGPMIGGAIMGIISLIGMMLTSSSKGSFTASGVQSAVTTHEAVRGVIAGETSIPIAQISTSLSQALSPHLNVLQKIEINTRGGGSSSGAAQGTVPVQVIVEGVVASIKAAMEEYFTQYLVMGARG